MYPILTYGYAMTLYKAQGSEWHTVMINLNSIYCSLTMNDINDINKRYNYKKSTFDFYIDITNWYGAKTISPPFYIFSYEANGSFKTTDGLPLKKDGSNAVPSFYENNTIFITPTIGFIYEF